jgi:type II secretory pathway predicted ATPase ExeA/nucleoid-associated protein YgaU
LGLANYFASDCLRNMILEHYKLADQPFGVTPDPRYFYLSPTHREAMASVMYGVSVNRGFTALVARPGMGKTTILFDLLRKLKSTHRTVFLFQSQCGPRGLLRALLSDLGIEDDGRDFLRMNSKLNEFLLREANEGRRLVVVIDEAQNLTEPVLEIVRMLSNFETTREKLMHVILSGQPQLAEKLSSPNLVQLRQRISIVARLESFDAPQTRQYINHRLAVAGYDRNSALFTDKAITLIARHSEGVPRTINNLCFNAMSLGCAMKQKEIDEKVVLEVLNDLDMGKLIDRARTCTVPSQEPPARLMPLREVRNELIQINRSKKVNRLRRTAVLAGIAGLLIWPVSQASVYAKRILSEHSPASAGQNTSLTPAAAALNSRIEAEKSAVARQPRPAGDGALASPAIPDLNSAPEIISAAPVAVFEAPSETHPPELGELVRISPSQTLFRISVHRYGGYSPELIRQIVEMNPQLRNPNKIKSGQILRLPEVPKATRKPSPAFSRYSNSAPEEVKAP